MNFIISQIVGIIALLLVCVSYFFKSKKFFLIFQIIANLFYGLSYIFVNIYGAGIITLISILRCLYLYFSEKYNFKQAIYFLPIFVVSYIIVGVIYLNSLLDIIPIITATIFTFSFYIKDMQIMRYTCLVPQVMLIIYAFLCKTYANALLNLIESLVIVVSIIKFYIENKQKKEIEILIKEQKEEIK